MTQPCAPQNCCSVRIKSWKASFGRSAGVDLEDWPAGDLAAVEVGIGRLITVRIARHYTRSNPPVTGQSQMPEGIAAGVRSRAGFGAVDAGIFVEFERAEVARSSGAGGGLAFASDLVSAIEARALWSRFGL